MSLVQTMDVLEQRILGPDLRELVLQAPADYDVEPGQFVMVQVDEGEELMLRRPFSVADFDAKESHLHLIYKLVGAGTKRMASWERGRVVSIMGPLGHGFPLLLPTGDERVQPRLLIGGGVGLAPLYYLAKVLATHQIPLLIAAGFRTEEESYYCEAFRQWGELIIATEDGTVGQKGRITEFLPPASAWECYYACGPKPMLEALTTQLAGKEGYLSLEERMACGIGVCQGCVHPSTKPFRVCADGPVISAEEVLNR